MLSPIIGWYALCTMIKLDCGRFAGNVRQGWPVLVNINWYLTNTIYWNLLDLKKYVTCSHMAHVTMGATANEGAWL